jgi:hypothetical protein
MTTITTTTPKRMLPTKERNDQTKAEMNERKIIQNKTCVQNIRKHRARNKNKQRIIRRLFCFFLDKEKTNHHSHKHKSIIPPKKQTPPYIIFDLLVNICRKIAQKKTNQL